MTIHVVIPARNEEEALPPLLRELAAVGHHHVIVVDNGSADRTADVARAAGVTVLHEPRVGYGSACLAALASLAGAPPDDIIIFLDADGSDDPASLPQLIGPLETGKADFVLASRTLTPGEPGALTTAQRFGNWLSCKLIAALWGSTYTDLAPLRAARLRTLRGFHMRARDYGWTVEMQIRAARQKLRVCEIPSRYRRRRLGRSKVSGTVFGSLRAGITILATIGAELFRPVTYRKG